MFVRIANIKSGNWVGILHRNAHNHTVTQYKTNLCSFTQSVSCLMLVLCVSLHSLWIFWTTSLWEFAISVKKINQGLGNCKITKSWIQPLSHVFYTAKLFSVLCQTKPQSSSQGYKQVSQVSFKEKDNLEIIVAAPVPWVAQQIRMVLVLVCLFCTVTAF